MTPIDRRSGFASANGAQIYYSGPAKQRQGRGAMHHGLAVASIGMAYRRFNRR
jgi:hypothetical protein